MQVVLILCVFNRLNDFIIPGKNWRPFLNNVDYMSFQCTYNTTIYLITKSSYFLIFLVWVLYTVCLFVIIYITLLGYLLTTLIDDIEV